MHAVDERPHAFSFMGLDMKRPTLLTWILALTFSGVAIAFLTVLAVPVAWPPLGRWMLALGIGIGTLVHRSGGDLHGATAFRGLLLTGLLLAPCWPILAWIL